MFRILILAVLVCAGGFAPADATVMRKLDLETLTATSDLIVLATVGEQVAAKRGARIVTRVQLKPVQVVKGAHEGAVTVEVMGGVIDGIGQQVSGTARFESGEQVIVFLSRLKRGEMFRVRGMAQGKLRVVPGFDGGRVVRDLDGLVLMEGRDDGAAGHEVEAAAQMPLDAFLRALATFVARHAVAEPSSPDTVAPGTVSPDTVAPGTVSPDTVAPAE